jgi:conjugal transfer pilus assembly protein TraE
MEVNAHISTTKDMLARVGADRMILALMILANIMLVAYLLVKQDTSRTHLVPPDISRPMWISKNAASDGYLEDMTLFAAQLILTTSPTGVEFAGERLKSLICGDAVGEFDSLIKQTALKLKRDNAATTYVPRAFTVDSARMYVATVGDVSTFISDRKVSSVQKAILFKWANRSGRYCLKEQYETTTTDLFGDRIVAATDK